MKYLDLITSRRVMIAAVTALIPVIAKELFGYTLSEDQQHQLIALAATLIGALTVRDHNPEVTK